MFIVWRRYGAVPLLVLIGALLLSAATGFADSHGRLTILLSFLAAAASAFAVAKLSDGPDSLFFIPMGGWAVILALAGPILMIAMFGRGGEDKPVEKPLAKASAAVPAPTAKGDVLQPQVAIPAPAPERPRSVAVAEPEPAMPSVKRVYADNQTKTYYPENCAGRPGDAYPMAKSLAVREGYKLAPGCKE